MPYRYGGLILVVIGACMVGVALLALYPTMRECAPDIVRIVALVALVCGGCAVAGCGVIVAGVDG